MMNIMNNDNDNDMNNDLKIIYGLLILFLQQQNHSKLV